MMTKKQRANIARYEKAEKKRKETLAKWEKLVTERKAALYFKPTRFKHDSGFRVMEVGYLTLDGKTNKMKTKIVLQSGSDHIHTDFAQLYKPSFRIPINIDLTMDGYFRIWGNKDQVLLWEDYPMSSAEITTVELRKESDAEHKAMMDKINVKKNEIIKQLNKKNSNEGKTAKVRGNQTRSKGTRRRGRRTR